MTEHHETGTKVRDFGFSRYGDDRLREECGVFGVFGHPEAAAITALGLHALQHRGQEGAGIVSYDGKQFHAERLGEITPFRLAWRHRAEAQFSQEIVDLVDFGVVVGVVQTQAER